MRPLHYQQQYPNAEFQVRPALRWKQGQTLTAGGRGAAPSFVASNQGVSSSLTKAASTSIAKAAASSITKGDHELSKKIMGKGFEEKNRDGVEAYKLGKYDKSVQAFQQALAVQERKTEKDDKLIAQTLANLGVAYARQDRMEEAADSLNKAHEMKEKLRHDGALNEAEDQAYLADVLNNLGNIACMQKKFGLSLHFYRSTLREVRLHNGLDSDLAKALHNIGRLHVLREEWNFALKALLHCVEVEKKLYGEDSIQRAGTIELIGFSYVSIESYDKAMVSFSEALGIYQTTFGSVHEQVATALVNVAMVMESTTNKGGALQTYLTAREVFYRVGVPKEHRGLQAALYGVKKLTNQLIDSREDEATEDRIESMQRVAEVSCEQRDDAP